MTTALLNTVVRKQNIYHPIQILFPAKGFSTPSFMDTPYLLQASQPLPASGDATKPAFQGSSLLEFQAAVTVT